MRTRRRIRSALGPGRLARVVLAAALCLALCLAMGACGSGRPEATGVTAPEGYRVEVFASGFVGPTQMIEHDGALYVAELNGGENDEQGRILRLPVDDPDRRSVLIDGLDKPTGLAVAGNRLWVMERNRLSSMTLDGSDRRVVVDDMPFNGRSQGTLTVTPDGSLLYDTSGSKRGAERVDGSGQLFRIADPATTAAASEQGTGGEPIASGFKHAYAQLIDRDGQLWSVEMTDGTFDGERATDELLAIEVGDDAGWPQCVDNNRPVIEFGGTPELCASSPTSHAIFGLGATPTSLAIPPWDSEIILATLWLPGEVVSVPRSPADEPHQPTVFLDGIESPQHLLVLGDELLVSDHETGQIFVVSRNG